MFIIIIIITNLAVVVAGEVVDGPLPVNGPKAVLRVGMQVLADPHRRARLTHNYNLAVLYNAVPTKLNKTNTTYVVSRYVVSRYVVSRYIRSIYLERVP